MAQILSKSLKIKWIFSVVIFDRFIRRLVLALSPVLWAHTNKHQNSYFQLVVVCPCWSFQLSIRLLIVYVNLIHRISSFILFYAVFITRNHLFWVSFLMSRSRIYNAIGNIFDGVTWTVLIFKLLFIFIFLFLYGFLLLFLFRFLWQMIINVHIFIWIELWTTNRWDDHS